MTIHERLAIARFYIISCLIWILIICLPSLTATIVVFLTPIKILTIAAPPLFLLIFCFAYPITCGILSLPFQSSIRPGLYPRKLATWKYASRRLYNQCWTATYYFTPIYNLWLSVPLLKSPLFYLFGYRGPSSFTIYADSWIRDLPLLTLGRGCYISNCAVLGTNVVMSNGILFVDRIVIGQSSLIGHGAKIAPGSIIDDGAEIGVATACGIGVHLEMNARIGFCSTIGHATIIRHHASVGNQVCIGQNVTIAPNLVIKSGAILPDEADLEFSDASFNAEEVEPTNSAN